jgi:NhaA family Na+:H+ antiporter
MTITNLFKEFFESEKIAGLVLLLATIISLALSNSFLSAEYIGIWNYKLLGHDIPYWINEALMGFFFLLIGLELERELYVGELKNIRNAMLPVFAAIGGMILPAGFYLIFNFGKPTQVAAGIPMATDIAFALGIISLLGKRVPLSLKIFLTALAVIDDLGAIIMIALVYSGPVVWLNLLLAMVIFGFMILLNRLKFNNLLPYLFASIFMWYFMHKSGIHATLTGILVAFAIPFRDSSGKSPSLILQHILHKPVAFFILPLFALANTSVSFENNLFSGLAEPHSLGILAGLLFGKPLGIALFSYFSVAAGICQLPQDINWRLITGTGFIAGIGFTMSIFITLLAFSDPFLISTSKIMIISASLIAGTIGFFFLKLSLKMHNNH